METIGDRSTRRAGKTAPLPAGLAPAFTVAGAVGAVAEDAALDERVAALRQSLEQEERRLRQYEWIETQVTSLKGEEESR